MATFDLARFDGFDPAVAPYISMLEFGRTRLLNGIKELTSEQLAQKPEGFKNSIATLVVHVAATEVSFAYRIMGQTVPEELLAEFPPHKETLLPEITGETVDGLKAKLEKSWAILLGAVEGLKAADMTREIQMGPERTATVAWLLNLLPVHLMLHTGHIQMIRQHI